ncbi:MAG TPA: NAD(P)H-binding protein [Kofleriaceae bacterium]|jgi:uncharacterized protein YbjT (DUF2867 family)
MYAITGVSGHTGSVAATTLLAQGKQVRVIVRDAAKGAAWKAKGADVAIADVDNEAALAAAFAGTEGVFVLLPPDMGSQDPLADQTRRTNNITAAAVTAKVPHLVLLSSIGAHLPSGTGPIAALGRAERAFAAAGIPFTAVRAAFFQENWRMSFGALAQNILPTFTPKAARFPQVATQDIGRTVAAALVEGAHGPRTIIELSGPREYSPDEAAVALSTITGTTITAANVSLDALVATFTGMGVTEPVARLYLEMYTGIGTGHIKAEAGNRTVRGKVELAETLAALLAK